MCYYIIHIIIAQCDYKSLVPKVLRRVNKERAQPTKLKSLDYILLDKIIGVTQCVLSVHLQSSRATD